MGLNLTLIVTVIETYFLFAENLEELNIITNQVITGK